MKFINKVDAFKKHFDIDSINANVEFCLDTKKNLVAKFGGQKYILTNQRNKKFLSYKTMKLTKIYGTKFLRAIHFEGLKKIVVRAKEVKKYTDRDMLISIFKYDNKIRKDWDIHSYTYVNEYGELMLSEKCCKDLKIPKSVTLFRPPPPKKKQNCSIILENNLV